ncbi:MAG: trypsin-like serine protease [Reyranellaceae bacterium]
MAIINGTEVNSTEEQQRGLVTIRRGCSGILLSSDWVMTAGHCLPVDRPNPALPSVTVAWAPGRNFPSDAMYQSANADQSTNPGPEFSLIHLSVPVPGIAADYRMQLYADTAGSLMGKTVVKYGRGVSTLADNNPTSGAPVGPGGAGPYRAANLVVKFASDMDFSITYERNQAGQILMPGDSGGPGIVWENGTAFLVGITRSGAPGAVECFNRAGITPAQIDANCKASIYAISGAVDTAIASSAVRHAVQAILKSSWNARLTSQTVLVYSPEITLIAPISNMDETSWTRSAVVANKLCYNRGFSAGHFDGHQNLVSAAVDHSFGLQCSGAGTVWRDIKLSDIPAGWGFSDLNAVPWAQANRAAERLCATANQGFAGGHFTGHQTRDPNGNVIAGLVCYRDGAQWFDASGVDLGRTGFGFSVPTIDKTSWAQAARAATGFCRLHNFSGGFMNGHQAQDRLDANGWPVNVRFGVVCQR